MKYPLITIPGFLFLFVSFAKAQETVSIPEVRNLNADDVSYAHEARLPDLKKPYICFSPPRRDDGIEVGSLGVDGGRKELILELANAIAAGDHGLIDSLLLYQDGKLLFESYYRRGRVNYPHFQMSITKSYTAMAIGRAIKLGHLSMEDIDRPVVGFLKDLDQSKLVSGANKITLGQAMNMRSGVRLENRVFAAYREAPQRLEGQKLVQVYLEKSAPIPLPPRPFKYQAYDPSMAMQVLQSVVPDSARSFIHTELLHRMGISNYAWTNNISGFPRSAAGSSMCSRDMIKWGMLVLNHGKWNGEELIPVNYVKQATSRLYTNRAQTSYGYFWWRHDMQWADQTFDCISGRGAGGQFILVLPKLKLIAAITAHNKGMGTMLRTFPKKVIPAFQ